MNEIKFASTGTGGGLTSAQMKALDETKNVTGVPNVGDFGADIVTLRDKDTGRLYALVDGKVKETTHDAPKTATKAEVLAGTVANKLVTPKTLKDKLDADTVTTIRDKDTATDKVKGTEKAVALALVKKLDNSYPADTKLRTFEIQEDGKVTVIEKKKQAMLFTDPVLDIAKLKEVEKPLNGETRQVGDGSEEISFYTFNTNAQDGETADDGTPGFWHPPIPGRVYYIAKPTHNNVYYVTPKDSDNSNSKGITATGGKIKIPSDGIYMVSLRDGYRVMNNHTNDNWIKLLLNGGGSATAYSNAVGYSVNDVDVLFKKDLIYNASWSNFTYTKTLYLKKGTTIDFEANSDVQLDGGAYALVHVEKNIGVVNPRTIIDLTDEEMANKDITRKGPSSPKQLWETFGGQKKFIIADKYAKTDGTFDAADTDGTIVYDKQAGMLYEKKNGTYGTMDSATFRNGMHLYVKSDNSLHTFDIGSNGFTKKEDAAGRRGEPVVDLSALADLTPMNDEHRRVGRNNYVFVEEDKLTAEEKADLHNPRPKAPNEDKGKWVLQQTKTVKARDLLAEFVTSGGETHTLNDGLKWNELAGLGYVQIEYESVSQNYGNPDSPHYDRVAVDQLVDRMQFRKLTTDSAWTNIEITSMNTGDMKDTGRATGPHFVRIYGIREQKLVLTPNDVTIENTVKKGDALTYDPVTKKIIKKAPAPAIGRTVLELIDQTTSINNGWSDGQNRSYPLNSGGADFIELTFRESSGNKRQFTMKVELNIYPRKALESPYATWFVEAEVTYSGPANTNMKLWDINMGSELVMLRAFRFIII